MPGRLDRLVVELAELAGRGGHPCISQDLTCVRVGRDRQREGKASATGDDLEAPLDVRVDAVLEGFHADADRVPHGHRGRAAVGDDHHAVDPEQRAAAVVLIRET